MTAATAGQTNGQVRTPPATRRTGLGGEDIEVTGESYRRDGVAQVFIAAGRPLGGVIMRTAVLIADPANQYDPFAVMVYVDGQHVGWIPTEMAPDVQPAVNTANASGRQLTVLARVWACCEEEHWSGRVTLSLSGATEPEWSYVEVGAWPGDRSPDGTQRLTQTGMMRRIGDGDAAGLIRGQDFESLRPDIAEAKAAGDVAGALSLLTECIEAQSDAPGRYGCGRRCGRQSRRPFCCVSRSITAAKLMCWSGSWPPIRVMRGRRGCETV